MLIYCFKRIIGYITNDSGNCKIRVPNHNSDESGTWRFCGSKNDRHSEFITIKTEPELYTLAQGVDKNKKLLPCSITLC
jgi:hypothetical protein